MVDLLPQPLSPQTASGFPNGGAQALSLPPRTAMPSSFLERCNSSHQEM